MSFIFHSDDGHGWLEVTTAQLKDVGVPLSSISPYSYRKGNTLYLEEDCDAGIFVQAYRAKHDSFDFEERNYNGQHWIRDLPRVTS